MGTASPGPSPIRRLTHGEYDETLRDLLGVAGAASAAFPAEERASVFSNDAAGQVVSRLLAEGYMGAAAALAPSAAARLEGQFPCAPDGDEEACARTALSAWGLRAFRRPLADAELDDLVEAFATGRAESDFRGGLAMAIEVSLQAPEFLYRVEVGDGAATAGGRRSGWELASRLSYMLWGTMPDDALLEAAANGRLDQRDGLREEARRMLDDARTRVTVARFFEEWLGLAELEHLEKDRSVYPTFSDPLPALFRAETLTFIDAVVWEGDGRMATLLTAPYTFASDRLGAFYGLPPLLGAALRRVDLDASRSAGLLTQGSFLATHAKFDQSSPIQRGKFVRERLLCTPLPPPPANLEIRPPAPDPRRTTRERFTAHTTDELCAGCHHLIDPIGLGFEHFDGVGLYREAESDQLVDARGDLTGTDVDGPFVGVPALAARLAESRDVERCIARQWFQFAYGRSDTSDDACAVEQLDRAFHASAGDLRELLLALAETPTFLARSSEAAR